MMNFKRLTIFTLLLSCAIGSIFYSQKIIKPSTEKKKLKLYWFIPDGLRADPNIFTIFKWAQEGKLPNLKKMMDNGTYGYSVPVFPGHSATNFATLLTGTLPNTHQIVDGPMRLPGFPLQIITRQGFSSTARETDAIWNYLEREDLKTAIISVPGSTPPELSKGITLRGRWGSWGIDVPSIVFHSSIDQKLMDEIGNTSRVFQYGAPLTKFEKPTPVSLDWQVKLPTSYSTAYETKLNAYNLNYNLYVYDSTNDQIENFDSVLIAKDKKHKIAELKEGQWTNWFPETLTWEEKNDYSPFTPKKSQLERSLSEVELNTNLKIKIIKLGKKNFFRIRMVIDNLNETLIDPSPFYEIFKTQMGPFIDFVDNYPPQLVYFDEDRKTFLDELELSMDWHRKVVGFMKNKFSPDVIIHDTYNPNQMLTSSWWLDRIDPDAKDFLAYSEEEKNNRFSEVLKMYQQIDAILGEMIAISDDETVLVFSSDHGIIPLNTEVRLNNLFAKKGWLKFTYDPINHVNKIDWKNTRVVFLNMDNIYINPKNLDGNYYRASGEDYIQLRNEVIEEISKLKDISGKTILDKLITHENLKELNIVSERTGDIVIANKPGYHWSEEVSSDGKILVRSFMKGYKQAVIPENSPGMLTPFVIVGPGIRKNYFLPNPINHVQQLPTIMKTLKINLPDEISGNYIKEIFSGK